MVRLSKVSVLGPMAVAVLALAGCPGPPPIQVGCSFVVTPTGTPETAAGGNVKVTVTTVAGCQWAFQGNDPWITVGPDPDAGSSGNGNGVVVLTAAANPGARRTGTATIAFQTVTVDQTGTGGSACTFQICPLELTFTGGAAGSGAFTITPNAENCGWSVSRGSILEDTVDLTGGGSGGRDDRFGVGTTTVCYQVKGNSQTSPWSMGGGNIVVRDPSQQQVAVHHVNLVP